MRVCKSQFSNSSTSEPISKEVDDYYSDEFESYEDDFEEFDDEPSEKIDSKPKDLIEINSGKNSHQESEHVVIKPLIDLNLTIKSMKNAALAKLNSKLQARYIDLRSVIDLDFVSHDLFDLPPMTEYSIYIQKYGNASSVQDWTQTNDDTLERYVQTDDWWMEDKWVQSTSDMFIESGTSEPVLPWLKASYSNYEVDNSDSKQNITLSVNTRKLDSFLSNASNVINILLEEEEKMDFDEISNEIDTSLEYSTGYISFLPPDFLKDWAFKFVKTTKGGILTVMVSRSLEPDVLCRSMLLFWHLNDPTHPYKVLTCEPEVTVCHIIDKLVICGTKIGTIQVWDLSEGSLAIMEDSSTFQHPSYSTDGIHTDHKEAICMIVLRNEGFQKVVHFKSIDSSFVCCSWVVTRIRDELKNTYDLDYGMRIGSSIAVRKINSIKLQIPHRNPTLLDYYKIGSSCQVSDEAILVGLDSGMLYLLSDSVQYPDTFFLDFTNYEPYIATLIKINPFHEEIFLVAYGSGELALFSTRIPVAIAIWNLNAPISAIEWSSHRPSVFYVIDETSLQAWDILENDLSPMVSTETKSLGKLNLLHSHPDPSLSSYLRGSRSLILGFDDGKIQVHHLIDSWTEPVVDELKILSEYIQDLVSKTKVRNI